MTDREAAKWGRVAAMDVDGFSVAVGGDFDGGHEDYCGVALATRPPGL